MRILMITSEWPTPLHPEWAPFIVQQVKSLRNEGIVVDVFAFRGAKNPLNYFTAWARLQRTYKLAPYDLIHAQFGQSGTLALFPKRLPLVVTFRGSDLHGIVGRSGQYTIPGKILRATSRLVARLADQVILVSRSLADLVPRGDCHIIPGGVDLDVFYPMPQTDARRALGLPCEHPIVLFGANPENTGKRFGLAESAVDLLKVRFPSIQLLPVAGIPHNRMPLYMNASDVLILVSRHEGSPTVVKEALACNLPVVTTDVGDVRTRLAGVAGCHVCTDDQPETIAAALAQVLSLRERVDGRSAVQHLDESLVVQEVIRVYRQAILCRN